MGHLFYDIVLTMVTINKSTDYKMDAFPMTLVYYFLETQVHISRPYNIVFYVFFYFLPLAFEPYALFV